MTLVRQLLSQHGRLLRLEIFLCKLHGPHGQSLPVRGFSMHVSKHHEHTPEPNTNEDGEGFQRTEMRGR